MKKIKNNSLIYKRRNNAKIYPIYKMFLPVYVVF